MSNSKLVDYVRLSPNCNKPRNHKIDKITIHHNFKSVVMFSESAISSL